MIEILIECLLEYYFNQHSPNFKTTKNFFETILNKLTCFCPKYERFLGAWTLTGGSDRPPPKEQVPCYPSQFPGKLDPQSQSFDFKETGRVELFLTLWRARWLCCRRSLLQRGSELSEEVQRWRGTPERNRNTNFDTAID